MNNIDDCRDSPENVPTCIAYNGRIAPHDALSDKKKETSRFKIVELLVFILPPVAAVFDVNDTENARFQTKPGQNFLSFSLPLFFFFASTN